MKRVEEPGKLILVKAGEDSVLVAVIGVDESVYAEEYSVRLSMRDMNLWMPWLLVLYDYVCILYMLPSLIYVRTHH